jgi:hypothetical protein
VLERVPSCVLRALCLASEAYKLYKAHVQTHRFHHAEPFLREHVTEHAEDICNVSGQLRVGDKIQA